MTRTRRTVRLPRRSGAAVLAIALLAGACGGPAPTSLSPWSAAPGSPPPVASAGGSAGTGDADARYATIEAQVEAIRGLRPTGAIARHIVDPSALASVVLAGFHRDSPPELLGARQALDRALLLIPADGSLEAYWTDLLTGQVIGLYDESTKAMYVRSTAGAVGPVESVIYAHEFTHALQDQAFGLLAVVGDAPDEGDRSLARRMLVEGDATLLMGVWAQANLTTAELMAAASASDPASQAVLDRTPAILREPMLAAYTDGMALALRASSSGGYAGVDALFASPPDSTEQVLHPDKLAAREAPVAVALPGDLATRLGTGWSVALQDTFGELTLRILLGDAAGVAAADATAAAAGWGGDRVALLEGPGGAQGVVLDTAWDTPTDATEFAAALAGLVTKLEAAGRAAVVRMAGPVRVVLLTGDSAATVASLASAMGLGG